MKLYNSLKSIFSLTFDFLWRISNKLKMQTYNIFYIIEKMLNIANVIIKVILKFGMDFCKEEDIVSIIGKPFLKYLSLRTGIKCHHRRFIYSV